MTNDNYDDPVQARRYVEWFSKNGVPGKVTTYVQTSSDKLIHFATMTDEDAIWVAKALHRDIMMPANGSKK